MIIHVRLYYPMGVLYSRVIIIRCPSLISAASLLNAALLLAHGYIYIYTHYWHCQPSTVKQIFWSKFFKKQLFSSKMLWVLLCVFC